MKIQLLKLFAAALILGFIALPLWLLGTSSGASWAFSLLESRAPVQLRALDGSLWRGLSVASLEYVKDAQVLRAEGFRLNLDWHCALRLTLCLERLEVDALSLWLPENGSTEVPRARVPVPEVPLPWPLAFNIEVFEVHRFELRQGASLTQLEDVRATLLVDSEQARLREFRARHVRSQVQGSADLSRLGDWNLELQATTQSLWLDASPPLLLPEGLRLKASGDLQAFDARLRPVEASGNPLDVVLRGRQEEQGEVFQVALSLSGLSAILPQVATSPWTQLEGPLDVDLSGNEKGLRVSFAQQLRNYTAQPSWLRGELSEQDGSWDLSQAQLGNASRPLLRASGVLGAPNDLHPRLQLNFDNFQPPDEVVEWLESMSGELKLSFDGSHPQRAWSLVSDALQLHTSEGDWTFEGKLRAAENLLLPLGESSLRRDDVALVYQRASSQSAAQLSLSEGLNLGLQVLPRLDAEIRPGERTRVNLSVAGELDATLESELWVDGSGVSFVVQPFEVRRDKQTVELRDALRGHWRQAQRLIELDAFCIDWRGNTACAEPSLLGTSGEFTARLRVDENIEQKIDAGNYSLHAVANGSLSASWAQSEIRASRLDLDFDELSLNPFAGEGRSTQLTWDVAALTAELTPDTGIGLSAKLQSAQAGLLQLDLQEHAEALDGQLKLTDLNLQALDSFLPEWRLLAGRVNAEMEISGSRDDPQLRGALLLTEGVVHLNSLDFAITDLRFELSGAGEDLELEGNALLGGGPIRMRGRCCDDATLTMQVNGEHNVIRLPQGLEADFSPDLELVLGRSRLALDGELRVHGGVLEHSGPRGGGVALSDDIRRIDGQERQARRFEVDARLRTMIDPGFTLRSEQLEATVSGDLRLDARARQSPQLFGNLQVLGGELRAYGQALRLTEGSAGFIGDPMNPQLSLSAERRIRAEDLRVGFRVGGTLDELELTLFSDPVMSEKDTLSYLLRGRGPDAGASMDGTALALSLGASAVNRSGVLESLNRIPGLSGVTIGAEGSEEDMAATLSAYVGERLYLSYGVGIYEPVNALTARLYLRSRLWLEVVSRLESSFDLYYRFDRE